MLDVKARVEEANAETVKRMIAGDQVLVDVVPAREAIPAFKGTGKLLLHSDPPVSWERMSGAQRGSLVATALFEGGARSGDSLLGR
ncbi:MAG: hypothetical protein ACUVQS_05400 [Candidatus Bipolaricaulaceae bacterium]